MFDFQRANSNNLQSTLRLNQSNEDMTQRWNINLQMSDFPTEFENSPPEQRELTCEIVDGLSATNQSDNYILIPLELISKSVIDGQTICYYRSRFSDEPGKALISNQIGAVVKLTETDKDIAQDPYALLTFSVNTQNATSQTGLNSADQGQRSAFVVTHRNENSNGGRDIPVDKMTRPMAPGDKLFTPNAQPVVAT